MLGPAIKFVTDVVGDRIEDNPPAGAGTTVVSPNVKTPGNLSIGGNLKVGGVDITGGPKMWLGLVDSKDGFDAAIVSAFDKANWHGVRIGNTFTLTFSITTSLVQETAATGIGGVNGDCVLITIPNLSKQSVEIADLPLPANADAVSGKLQLQFMTEGDLNGLLYLYPTFSYVNNDITIRYNFPLNNIDGQVGVFHIDGTLWYRVAPA